MPHDPNSGYPQHLRPVPGPGEATAPVLEEPASGTPGLTPPMSRGRSGRFITDVLVDLGYLPVERAEAAVGEARTAGRTPEQLLLEQGAITADQLSRAIAERYGLYHVDLNVFHVDMAAATLLPVSSARRYHAVPIGYEDKQTLLVAMSDPGDVLAADDIQMATGLACKIAVAAAEDVEALVGRLNTLQSAVSEAVEEESQAEEGEGVLGTVDSLHASPEDAPVVKLV